MVVVVVVVDVRVRTAVRGPLGGSAICIHFFSVVLFLELVVWRHSEGVVPAFLLLLGF